MKEKFALDKINFILIAIGVVIIIAGLLLMTGPSSTEMHFEPDIFSTRRIVVAPFVSRSSPQAATGRFGFWPSSCSWYPPASAASLA